MKFIKTFFPLFIALLSTFGQANGDWLDSFISFSQQAFNTVSSAVSVATSGYIDVENFVETALEEAGGFFRDVADAANDAAESVGDAANDAVDAIGDVAEDAVDAAGAFAQLAVGQLERAARAVEAAARLAIRYLKVGINFIKAAAQFIIDAFSCLWDVVTENKSPMLCINCVDRKHSELERWWKDVEPSPADLETIDVPSIGDLTRILEKALETVEPCSGRSVSLFSSLGPIGTLLGAIGKIVRIPIDLDLDICVPDVGKLLKTTLLAALEPLKDFVISVWDTLKGFVNTRSLPSGFRTLCSGVTVSVPYLKAFHCTIDLRICVPQDPDLNVYFEVQISPIVVKTIKGGGLDWHLEVSNDQKNVRDVGLFYWQGFQYSGGISRDAATVTSGTVGGGIEVGVEDFDSTPDFAGIEVESVCSVRADWSLSDGGKMRALSMLVGNSAAAIVDSNVSPGSVTLRVPLPSLTERFSVETAVKEHFAKVEANTQENRRRRLQADSGSGSETGAHASALDMLPIQIRAKGGICMFVGTTRPVFKPCTNTVEELWIYNVTGRKLRSVFRGKDLCLTSSEESSTLSMMPCDVTNSQSQSWMFENGHILHTNDPRKLTANVTSAGQQQVDAQFLEAEMGDRQKFGWVSQFSLIELPKVKEYTKSTTPVETAASRIPFCVSALLTNELIANKACHGFESQLFALTSSGQIINKRDGLCLTRPERDGDTARLETCMGSTRQRFFFNEKGQLRNGNYCLSQLREWAPLYFKPCVPPEVRPVCDGVLSPAGNHCCPESCGTCGGPGCSARPGGSTQCCTGRIAESGRYCDRYDAPCLVPQKSKFCDGIQASNTCCSDRCGSCGGSGCSRRPGGASECCSGKILETERICGLGYSKRCKVLPEEEIETLRAALVKGQQFELLAPFGPLLHRAACVFIDGSTLLRHCDNPLNPNNARVLLTKSGLLMVHNPRHPVTPQQCVTFQIGANGVGSFHFQPCMEVDVHKRWMYNRDLSRLQYGELCIGVSTGRSIYGRTLTTHVGANKCSLLEGQQGYWIL